MIVLVPLVWAQEVWIDVFDGHPIDGILRTSLPLGDEVPRLLSGPLAPRDLEREPEPALGVGLDYAVWLPPDGGWAPAARYTVEFGEVQQTFRAGAGSSSLPTVALTIPTIPPWTRRSDGTYVRDLTLRYTVEGDPWSWTVFVDPSDPRAVAPFRLGPGQGGLVQRQVGLDEGTLTPACVTLYAFAGSGVLSTPSQVCATDAPPPLAPIPPLDTGCRTAPGRWSLPLGRR